MNHDAVFDSCCQREIPFKILRINDQITPTDLKRNLGNENIVDVYSRTCTPIQRKLIGCDSKLKGPGNLWIDPNGGTKRQLTPINVEKVQALTHQAILQIGEEIETKIDMKNTKLAEKIIEETLEFAK